MSYYQYLVTSTGLTVERSRTNVLSENGREKMKNNLFYIHIMRVHFCYSEMVVYNLYVLGKGGQSLFYREWLRERKGNLTRSEEDKLMAGLIFSLSNFCRKMALQPDSATFKSLKVPTQKACSNLTTIFRRTNISCICGRARRALSLFWTLRPMLGPVATHWRRFTTVFSCPRWLRIRSYRSPIRSSPNSGRVDSINLSNNCHFFKIDFFLVLIQSPSEGH